LMRRWRELLIAGEPGEIEARMQKNGGSHSRLNRAVPS
jgi:hypothetical protein